MGLFKSLGNILQKKISDLNEAVHNPVADGEAAIRQSEKKIAEFQEEIANLMARNNQIKHERDDLKADAEKYGRIAESAVTQGKEDSARQALQLQEQKETVLKTFEDEVAANEAIIANLRAELERARSKVEEAKSNQARLTARLEGAKIREGLADSQSQLSTNTSSFAALDTLEKEVDKAEARASAKEELVGQEPANVAKKLEEEFLSTSSSTVEDRLAALKAKHSQPQG